jgi:hypothetical protein
VIIFVKLVDSNSCSCNIEHIYLYKTWDNGGFGEVGEVLGRGLERNGLPAMPYHYTLLAFWGWLPTEQAACGHLITLG